MKPVLKALATLLAFPCLAYAGTVFNPFTGTIDYTGSGSGGGGGGGAVFIAPPFPGTSISTFTFPPNDFNIVSDGIGASTVTVKNATGTWTAAQSFSSATFKYAVSFSSITISTNAIILGTSDYSLEGKGVYLTANPPGNNGSNNSPVLKFITSGDNTLAATILPVYSSFTIQMINDATAPQTPTTSKLLFFNVDGSAVFGINHDGPMIGAASIPTIFSTIGVRIDEIQADLSTHSIRVDEIQADLSTTSVDIDNFYTSVNSTWNFANVYYSTTTTEFNTLKSSMVAIRQSTSTLETLLAQRTTIASDEGGAPGVHVTRFDFAGAGVAASQSGSTLTVTIAGGAAGGGGGGGGFLAPPFPGVAVTTLTFPGASITSSGQGASTISFIASLVGSTYTTITDFANSNASAGQIIGGTITISALAGAVDVGAGSGFFRTTDFDTAPMNFGSWPSSGQIPIPANQTRYLGAQFAVNTTSVIVKLSDSWNYDTEFPLGLVVNEGGVLYITTNPWKTGDNMTNVIERFESLALVSRDNRVGGLILSNTGTRNVAVTAGAILARMSEFTIGALDTSVSGTFAPYYRDGSNGFTKESAATAWENTKYDDGSGTLASLTVLNYASRWFYVMTDGTVAMVYGRAQYSSLAAALNDSPPSTLPDRLSKEGILIGRFIIQAAGSTPATTQSAFGTAFTAGSVTSFSDLSGTARLGQVEGLDSFESSVTIRIDEIQADLSTTAVDIDNFYTSVRSTWNFTNAFMSTSDARGDTFVNFRSTSDSAFSVIRTTHIAFRSFASTSDARGDTFVTFRSTSDTALSVIRTTFAFVTGYTSTADARGDTFVNFRSTTDTLFNTVISTLMQVRTDTSTLVSLLKTTSSELSDNTNTINGVTNPVSWNSLKDVPAGFADGTDDGAGGAGDGDSFGNPTSTRVISALFGINTSSVIATSSITAYGGFTSTVGYIGASATFTWVAVSGSSISFGGTGDNTAWTMVVSCPPAQGQHLVATKVNGSFVYVAGGGDASGSAAAPAPSTKYVWMQYPATSLLAGGTDFASLEATSAVKGLAHRYERAFNDYITGILSTEAVIGSHINPSDLDTSSTVVFMAYVRAKAPVASKNIQLVFKSSDTIGGTVSNFSLTNSTGADLVPLSSIPYQETRIRWEDTVSHLGWASEDHVFWRLERGHDMARLTTTDLLGDMYLSNFMIGIPVKN